MNDGSGNIAKGKNEEEVAAVKSTPPSPTRRKAATSPTRAKAAAATSPTRSKALSSEQVTGACSCGAVTIKVDQKKIDHVSYCHCNSCRCWHSAPVALYMAIKPPYTHTIEGQVLCRRTYDGDNWATYRSRCASCRCDLGCRVEMKGSMPVDGEMKMESEDYLPVALFFGGEGSKVGWDDKIPKPNMHSFYSLRVIDIKDGLPKYETWKGAGPEMKE
ncbi:hypothetical protein HK101_003936 [Irineochytrium annulatum]|nr:hypothetical protein HK101_003936 [Irineochytrium annulatum]